MSFTLLNIYTGMIHWMEAHSLPCVVQSIWHVDCPGCGFQRSFIALLKGDPVASLKYYPALIPMFLFFAFLIINKRYQFSQSKKITYISIASVFLIIFGSYLIKFI